jgi:Kef-type K+ transport system membrane component KefB
VADTASAEHLKVLMEEESLNSLGHDFLIFLAAAVVAEPLGKILNVTPVLLYLLFGAVAGPYGLSVFTSGTEVNSEIGDYGILFLLFVEGLNLSPERLKALGSFFSLGATQLLLSVGLIFFGLFFGGPFLLPFFQDVRVPIDPTVVTDLFRGPVVAFSIAAAGALSSSAFVLPILKEKVRGDTFGCHRRCRGQ